MTVSDVESVVAKITSLYVPLNGLRYLHQCELERPATSGMPATCPAGTVIEDSSPPAVWIPPPKVLRTINFKVPSQFEAAAAVKEVKVSLEGLLLHGIKLGRCFAARSLCLSRLEALAALKVPVRPCPRHSLAIGASRDVERQ